MTNEELLALKAKQEALESEAAQIRAQISAAEVEAFQTTAQQRLEAVNKIAEHLELAEEQVRAAEELAEEFSLPFTMKLIDTNDPEWDRNNWDSSSC